MILVTGATGLVGGHLIWHLLQFNNRVVAVRRITSNLNAIKTIFSFYTTNPDEFLNKIEWKIADLTDEDSLREAMRGITIVYHCAAVVDLMKNNNNMMDTNVVGTRNMVELALEMQIEKFCFVSSIAACGSEGEGMIVTEDSPWLNNKIKTPYAISKYNSEQEVWKGIYKGLNAVIVNPGVILGVSGTLSGSAKLFDLSRKGMLFYTKGSSGYIDVQDVVKIMIQLTKSEIVSERFILVGENRANQEILNMMADGFKTIRPIIRVGKRLLLCLGFIAEIGAKILGVEPFIDKHFAKSTTNKTVYSSQKIIDAIGYNFKSTSKTIFEVCQFILQNRLKFSQK